MRSKASRLDRFIAKSVKGVYQKDVRMMLAQKRVFVDGILATNISQQIDEFSHVRLDDRVLQDKVPVYIMLNKPKGVVSATRDAKHKTVIDLIDRSDANELHIVGRLDLNSTGLLLLTTDGRWSRRIMSPEHKVSKVYQVELEETVTEEYVDAFERGMYFEYEDITTLPAKLKIISEFSAEVTLMEGRYHQIKRMFGRFNNKVLGIHRVSIGDIHLDSSLQPGQFNEIAVDYSPSHRDR